MKYILKEACNEFNLNYNKIEIPPAPFIKGECACLPVGRGGFC